MLSLIATLMTIAFVAIPIVIVVTIVRRLARISQRLRDSTRLQQAFAESAAAALRRVGAGPESVAKIEGFGEGPAVDRAADRNAAAYEARIGLQRKGGYAVQARPPSVPASVPPRLFEGEPGAQPLQRPPRPRPRPTQSPSLGLDMGESFRLSEPPEINEPHVPFAVPTWFALVLFAGAAAYCFLR